MNPLHLLWIVPTVFYFGYFTAALMVIASDKKL